MRLSILTAQPCLKTVQYLLLLGLGIHDYRDVALDQRESKEGDGVQILAPWSSFLWRAVKEKK